MAHNRVCKKRSTYSVLVQNDLFVPKYGFNAIGHIALLCYSYNLNTWAHKRKATWWNHAIFHRSFRHTEILVLSWWNLISPRYFWFHQELTRFTKSQPISPRLNLFHQDIFDFAKIFSISPRVHPFHQVRISPGFSPIWVDPINSIDIKKRNQFTKYSE